MPWQDNRLTKHTYTSITNILRNQIFYFGNLPNLLKLSICSSQLSLCKKRPYLKFSGLYNSAFGLNMNTPYLSVFSPNVGKYNLKKLRIQALFTQCVTFKVIIVIFTILTIAQCLLPIFKLHWPNFYIFSNTLSFSLLQKNRPIITDFKVRQQVIHSGSCEL